jgi:hypothetical protein
MVDSLANLVKRLELAVVSMEQIIGTSGVERVEPAGIIPDVITPSAPAPAFVSPIVSVYDSSLLSKFPSILETAGKIDPQILNIVKLT